MSDEAPLVGEPLALDLVNTRPVTGDLLTTLDGLRAWLRLQADRFPEMHEILTRLTKEDLADVRMIREHTAEALARVRRGERPAEADLEALNRTQGAAPLINELSWNGSTTTGARRRIGPPGTRLAGWLAEAAADLLSDPAVAKIRECAADDCVLLFLPAHSRRRWCSAARCGNRARVARHYQRHKTG
ncbi:putative RNA-binding Zn ribbon-like protein [Saccharopolyspora lacisalsi]|uniref:Putative RNA-binding Zn ribbon-like protein n=1 Tax=Halosaccharopolyspora lacisalsi TaxID=1000566 RepID=A0A839DZ61_9PSEU|nr:ABATE domain-containing protein [Halosaccharopolyspora lacisalsi]MBA8824777.1 putative RNA-binding Zn ribbon-like protein [Halosaccharopolyspora lacisalsi]